MSSEGHCELVQHGIRALRTHSAMGCMRMQYVRQGNVLSASTHLLGAPVSDGAGAHRGMVLGSAEKLPGLGGSLVSLGSMLQHLAHMALAVHLQVGRVT